MDASRAPTTAQRVLQVHLRHRQPYNKLPLSNPPQDLAVPRPPSTILAPRQEPNFSSTTVSATPRHKSTTRRSRLSNSTRRTRDLLVNFAQRAVPAPAVRVSAFLWPLENTASCYTCCHHWTTLAPTTPTEVEVSQPNTSKVSIIHLLVAAIKQLFLVPRNAQLSKLVLDIPWLSLSADTSAHFPISARPRIRASAIHLPTSTAESSRDCHLGNSNSKAPRRKISSAKLPLPLSALRKPHSRSSQHLLSSVLLQDSVNLLLVEPRVSVEASANHNDTSESRLYTAYTLQQHSAELQRDLPS